MTDSSSRRFDGRRVVVIGSGWAIEGYDDIGRASALAFGQEGAEVAIVQLTREMADTAVDEIRAAGGTAYPFAHDPRNPADLEPLAEQIGRRWTGVDVLVTHHFATYVSGIQETTLEQWEETLRVNLTGVFAATKAFMPLLRQGTDAAVVHVGSLDGRLGNPNIPSYSASKGGVHVLVHTLAGELAQYGIRVNAIERAASTALPLDPRVIGELNAQTPLARAADPAEYAAAIAFLASSAASYITGVVLPVDGGRTAVTPGTSPGYRGYGTPA
jgi:NAD(P)-dependent dehydrogenase (short-subunit alcohol dehydrogenase family)